MPQTKLSSSLLHVSNLVLWICSGSLATLDALAFRRTSAVHAQSASRARVLHVPHPSRHVAPLVFPTPQSRATHSPSHQNTPSSPGALQHRRQSPLAARRRSQCISAMSAPPKPLPLATCPWNSSASSSRVSSSSRRRHDALPLQGGSSPANLSMSAANRPRRAI